MAERFIQKLTKREDREIDHSGEIVVIGLGRFGSSLANTLVSMGYEVLGVDLREDIVQNHASVLTHVIQSDTTTAQALRQIGVAEAYTAVVCIGTGIESSVLTTAALADLEVPNIWAKAITEAHGTILRRVGAHDVVFPEAEMGQRVAHLVTGKMMEYVSLDDDFVIVETKVPTSVAGKTLGEAELRAKFRVTVVCIKPDGGMFTYAERDTVMKQGDLIVVAGHVADVEKFAEKVR